MEKRNIEWYLNHDYDKLTTNQKLIIDIMKLGIKIKTSDANNALDYSSSYNNALVVCKKLTNNNRLIESSLSYVYPHDVFDIARYSQVSIKHKPNNNPKTYIAESHGFYKIGKSVCPSDRIKHMRIGNPSLKLLYVSNDNNEIVLHKLLSKYNIESEWFDIPNNVLLDIIDKYNFKPI